MPDVDELLRKIKEDRNVWRANTPNGQKEIRYKDNFLHDVGTVYEREGLDVTRLYLVKKKQARETRSQAEGLSVVLDHIADCPPAVSNRSIGRLVIQVLRSIRDHESQGG